MVDIIIRQKAENNNKALCLAASIRKKLFVIILNGDIFIRTVQGAGCYDAVFYKQSKRGVSKSCNKLPIKKDNKYVRTRIVCTPQTTQQSRT